MTEIWSSPPLVQKEKQKSVRSGNLNKQKPLLEMCPDYNNHQIKSGMDNTLAELLALGASQLKKKKNPVLKKYSLSKGQWDKWWVALGKGGGLYWFNSRAVLSFELTQSNDNWKEGSSGVWETCKIRGLVTGLPIVRLIKKWLIITRFTSNNHWAIKSWLSGVNKACDCSGGKSMDICSFISGREPNWKWIAQCTTNLHCDKGAINRNTCLVNDNYHSGSRPHGPLRTANEESNCNLLLVSRL